MIFGVVLCECVWFDEVYCDYLLVVVCWVCFDVLYEEVLESNKKRLYAIDKEKREAEDALKSAQECQDKDDSSDGRIGVSAVLSKKKHLQDNDGTEKKKKEEKEEEKAVQEPLKSTPGLQDKDDDKSGVSPLLSRKTKDHSELGKDQSGERVLPVNLGDAGVFLIGFREWIVCNECVEYVWIACRDLLGRNRG